VSNFIRLCYPELTCISIGPQILEVDDSPSDPKEEEEALTKWIQIKRGQDQNSRNAITASKYGFDYSKLGAKFYQDAPRSDRLRVEKKIRMRKRYTCHQCSNHFGRGQTCSKCNHTRCNECKKYPERRRRSERPEGTTAEENLPLASASR
jgi:hypothetical protein